MLVLDAFEDREFVAWTQVHLDPEQRLVVDLLRILTALVAARLPVPLEQQLRVVVERRELDGDHDKGHENEAAHHHHRYYDDGAR